MTLALAIDLGGTKVEAALVDSAGAIVPGSRTREATGAAAAQDRTVLERAVASVVSRCRALPEWGSVTAAGIGSAGPIDATAGTVAPINLPAVHGVTLVDLVRQALRMRPDRLVVGEVRGGEVVQPSQPVRPGDDENVAMAQVDRSDAGLQRALLAVRVAVVPGHPVVGGAGRCGDRLHRHACGNAAYALPLPAAPGASAVQRQVAQVDLESHLRAEPLGQVLGRGHRRLLDPAAVGAHQMHVRLAADGVVRRRAVVQVGMGDQTDLLQALHGPVHRRQADVGQVALHVGGQLVDGGVSQPVHGLQHRSTLSGAAQTGGTQSGVAVGIGGTGGADRLGIGCSGVAGRIGVARHQAGPAGAAPSSSGSMEMARWLLSGCPMAAMS